MRTHSFGFSVNLSVFVQRKSSGLISFHVKCQVVADAAVAEMIAHLHTDTIKRQVHSQELSRSTAVWSSDEQIKEPCRLTAVCLNLSRTINEVKFMDFKLQQVRLKCLILKAVLF